MEPFLHTEISGNKLEFTIDTNIFPKDIILKTAFSFLDRGYFFFTLDENKNIILQLTKRDENSEDLEKIIGDFSDALLEMTLRDKLEKDNKTIRETIVEKAINGPFDTKNFVTLDTDNQQNNEEQNQIDFDKDIDEILKEIENDPDLKIDEEEIENILKEIEEETSQEPMKPTITVDPEAVKNFKNNMKNNTKK